LSVSKQNSGINTEEGLVTPKTRTKDLSSIKIVEPSHVRFLKRKESHSPNLISHSTPDYFKRAAKRREKEAKEFQVDEKKRDDDKLKEVYKRITERK